jgi:predicted dehydrogenase
LYTATVKHETPMQLSIFGTRGTLEVRPGWLEWTAGSTSEGKTRVSRTDRGYSGQWRNFIDAIRVRAAVVSSAERAFGDLKLIAAALRSASQGKPVRLREFG